MNAGRWCPRVSLLCDASDLFLYFYVPDVAVLDTREFCAQAAQAVAHRAGARRGRLTRAKGNVGTGQPPGYVCAVVVPRTICLDALAVAVAHLRSVFYDGRVRVRVALDAEPLDVEVSS